MLIDRCSACRPATAVLDLGRRRRPRRVRHPAVRARRSRRRWRRLERGEGPSDRAARRGRLHRSQRVRGHDAARGDETADEERARFKESRRFGKAVEDLLGEPPDIVFEHVGKATFPTSVLVVKPFGKVVICGATSGYQLDFDVRYLWMRQKEIIGSHFANAWEATKANQLIEESKIRPVLWRTMGFEECRRGSPAAARQSSKHLGKIKRDPRRRHRRGPGPDRRGSRRDPRRGRRLAVASAMAPRRIMVMSPNGGPDRTNGPPGVVHVQWYATVLRQRRGSRPEVSLPGRPAGRLALRRHPVLGPPLSGTTATRSPRWSGSSPTRVTGTATGKGPEMIEFRRRLTSGPLSDPDHLRVARRARRRRPRPRGSRLDAGAGATAGTGARRPSPDVGARVAIARCHRLCLASVTRTHKIVNLIGVLLPLAGLVAAIVLLWHEAIHPLELGLLRRLLRRHRPRGHCSATTGCSPIAPLESSSRLPGRSSRSFGSMAIAGVGDHVGRRSPPQAPRVHRP